MLNSLDILFGVAGQSLYFDATEGRPSSVASVEVWREIDGDSSETEVAVAAPSVEATSLTINAASGAAQSDPTKINLSAVTGLVRGRQYLATNSYGEREWIEIERIDTPNTTAYSRSPLHNDYATDDTLVSTRMTAIVNSLWVADVNNLSNPMCPKPQYRHVWTYTVSSVVYRNAGYFDHLRYPFGHSVTPADVDRLSRGWFARLSQDDRLNQGEAILIEAGYQVRLDLWERGISDYAQRNSEVLNELIRRKAVALVSEAAYRHGGVSRDLMESDEATYWKRITALVAAGLAPQQATEDGAGSTTPRLSIWRR
jgi:hypothetical protein